MTLIPIMIIVNWLPCATSLSPPMVMEMMTDALLQARATAPLPCLALCQPPYTVSHGHFALFYKYRHRQKMEVKTLRNTGKQFWAEHGEILAVCAVIGR